MLDVGKTFLDNAVVHNEIFESLSICVLFNCLSDDTETIQVNLFILSVLLIISVKTQRGNIKQFILLNMAIAESLVMVNVQADRWLYMHMSPQCKPTQI